MASESTHRETSTPSVSDSSETAGYLCCSKCAYCGSSENVQLEHVIPLKRGGKHSLDNLVLACKPCNISKNAKLLLEVACKPALLIYKRAHTNV